MRAHRHALVPAFAAFAPVVVLASGCDPLGFWSTKPLGDLDDAQTIVPVDVQSPAAGLDGLMDHARPDGTPCARGDVGCVHVGRVREVALGRPSCDGLALADSLELFTWTCTDAGEAGADGEQAVARGTLRDDKGLADLVDVDALAVRALSFEARRGGEVVARSEPAAWWSTSVALAGDGAALTGPDVVYVATDATTLSVGGAERVGLIGAGGMLRAFGDNAFVWIEGTFRGDDEEAAVDIRDAAYLLVRRVSAFGGAPANTAANDGVSVEGTDITLSDIDVTAGNVGVRISPATRIRVERVRTTGNYTGLLVSETTDLVAHDIATSNSGSSAIHIHLGARQTWRGVVMVGQTYGFAGGGGSDIHIADVTSVDTEVGAIDMHTMTRLDVSGLLSIDELVAVRITEGATSSDLRFADIAVLGANPRVFSFSDGEPPGTRIEGAQIVGGLASADAIVGVVDGAPESFTQVARADGSTFDVALRKDTALVDALALDAVSALVDAEPEGGAAVVLERARELAGDGDGRCEPLETCAAATDIGAYQGHGGLRAPAPLTLGGATFHVAAPVHNGV